VDGRSGSAKPQGVAQDRRPSGIEKDPEVRELLLAHERRFEELKKLPLRRAFEKHRQKRDETFEAA
jgi:hypothetical protein